MTNARSQFIGAATFSLFESMVLDFSFWKLDDMKRVIHFARANPELAIHVHRLQLRVPATTTPFWGHLTYPGPPLAAYLRSGLASRFELNQHQFARIQELITVPLETQWEHDIHNFDAVRKIMHEMMAVLPKLHRVGNAVSTHEPERLAMACQQVWDEMGIDLSWYFPTVAYDQGETLSAGASYLMTSLTNNITSLKLREVAFQNRLYHWRIPDQVRCLDIELRNGQDWGVLKDPMNTCFAVQDWRKQFAALKRLKTLRLCLSTVGLHPNEDEWFRMDGPVLYMDDLLTGTELSEDRLQTPIDELEYRKQEGISEAGVINACTFPRLESLTLINCALREDGLLYLFAMHQQTLQNLALHRVVFDAAPDQISPIGVAIKCNEYLPDSTHLALSKIDLYDPKSGFSDRNVREWVAAVYPRDKEEGGGSDGLVRYAWDLGRMVEGEFGADP